MNSGEGLCHVCGGAHPTGACTESTNSKEAERRMKLSSEDVALLMARGADKDPKVDEWLSARGLESAGMLEVELPDGQVTGMEFDKSDLGTQAYPDLWKKMTPEWKQEAKKPSSERSQEWSDTLHSAVQESIK